MKRKVGPDPDCPICGGVGKLEGAAATAYLRRQPGWEEWPDQSTSYLPEEWPDQSTSYLPKEMEDLTIVQCECWGTHVRSS